MYIVGEEQNKTWYVYTDITHAYIRKEVVKTFQPNLLQKTWPNEQIIFFFKGFFVRLRTFQTWTNLKKKKTTYNAWLLILNSRNYLTFSFFFFTCSIFTTVNQNRFVVLAEAGPIFTFEPWQSSKVDFWVINYFQPYSIHLTQCHKPLTTFTSWSPSWYVQKVTSSLPSYSLCKKEVPLGQLLLKTAHLGKKCPRWCFPVQTNLDLF